MRRVFVKTAALRLVFEILHPFVFSSSNCDYNWGFSHRSVIIHFSIRGVWAANEHFIPESNLVIKDNLTYITEGGFILPEETDGIFLWDEDDAAICWATRLSELIEPERLWGALVLGSEGDPSACFIELTEPERLCAFLVLEGDWVTWDWLESKRMRLGETLDILLQCIFSHSIHFIAS